MQTILITGGTGFLGRALAMNLKTNNKVILTGRNNELNERVRDRLKCHVVPMDITNIMSIRETIAIYRPDIIIHAAATKYVHLAEVFPNECVDINIKGSQNIAQAAIEGGVKTVIGISTDKASSQRSFYGITKNVMERLFSSLDGAGATRFACVRFGNLAWSTGSVLTLWKNMIENIGLIETTGRHMTRFYMKLDDAVNLVLTAKDNVGLIGGGVLFTSMKSVSINKLLEEFLKMYGGSYKDIPERKGENKYEILINDLEGAFTEVISIAENSYFLLNFNKKQNQMNSIKLISTDNQIEMTREDILDLIKFDERSAI